MRHHFLWVSLLALGACQETTVQAPKVYEDNSELAAIYQADQQDRRNQPIDWEVVSKNDRQREARVYEMLDSNMVHTSKDYHHAAMVFQHGQDSVAYGMAVKLMRKSIALDSTANKWLLAAAIDRDLLSRNKPQIYGTQYWRLNGQPWELQQMDTTQITDAERIEYGVETLAQQREKLKQMNRKKLASLLEENSSIEALIAFIRAEDKKNPTYDISESAINRLGYQLMNKAQQEEALLIFELNTELYPNAFNTWDSYGECLLALGNKKTGLEAYAKSLALNPKNDHAKRILEKENNNTPQ